MLTASILALLKRNARQNFRKVSPPRPCANQTTRPLSRSMTSV